MIVRMKRALGIILGLVLALMAGGWLFYLTPSRGAQRDDTIRFGFWGDYQEYQMWQKVIAAFRQEHPRIRVSLEYVPIREYSRKLQTWITSDTVPDVAMMQDEPFPRHIANSQGARPVLMDLTPLIAGQSFGPDTAIRRQDYWQTAWDSFGRAEKDGWHQYALPLFGGNNLILYNRDCFRRAGVPLPDQTHIDENWTVEQFEELCRQLTIRKEVNGQMRTVQWGFSRPYSWLYWLPFIYACDADILNADRTEFVFTGPGARRSLELWSDLRLKDQAVPTGADLAQMGEDVAFLSGTVAMFTSGPWLMPFLNEAKVDYGVLFPPRSPTGQRGTRITWDCVAIPGRLKNDPPRLKMAYELASFIASPEAARIFAQAQRSIPANLAGTEPLLAGSDPSRAAKFVAALEFSRIQPITIKWDEMDTALRNGLEPLTRGEKDAQGSLDLMSGYMLGRRILPVRTPDGTLLRLEGGK